MHKTLRLSRALLRHVLSSLLILCTLAVSVVSAQDPAVYGYKVVKTYPHEIANFTQGLVYHDGYLFEGTGKRGLSTLGKRSLDSNSPLMSKHLSDRYFGEGIEIVGDRIFQLTWQSHIVFVYNKQDFEQLDSFYNATEGWGLAYDGERLILSDGTSTLRFMDPENFTPLGKIDVTLNGNPVAMLNELEYIDGEIWANVWMTDFIVRIDPATGVVNSYVDLTGLSAQTQLGSNEAVLNGIAWDAENRRLFVTGKHWADLFEIELVAK